MFNAEHLSLAPNINRYWAKTALGCHLLLLAAILFPRLWAAEQPNSGLSLGAPGQNQIDPDRPPPPLPIEAMFTGPYSLELTITADRDGAVRDTKISKSSKLKELDEYTRKWVERKWKMPLAKPEEPALRTFIAPFVYPKKNKWPPKSKHPTPPYPSAMLRNHQEGIVVLEMDFSDTGRVEAIRVVLSSGNKGVDDYTADWVRRKWSLPPGNKGVYRAPFAFLMQ